MCERWARATVSTVKRWCPASAACWARSWPSGRRGGPMTEQAGDGSVALKPLILVPAVITLAITLLRLTGEGLEWSPPFFGREAGGAMAIVGIVWLVPVLGA